MNQEELTKIIQLLLDLKHQNCSPYINHDLNIALRHYLKENHHMRCMFRELLQKIEEEIRWRNSEGTFLLISGLVEKERGGD